jgi:hypothetical protein
VSATWSTIRPVYSAFEFSRCAGCDELFLLSTKPFWTADATVLKPMLGIDYANDAPERRILGAQTNQTVGK